MAITFPRSLPGYFFITVNSAIRYPKQPLFYSVLVVSSVRSYLKYKNDVTSIIIS